MIRQGDVLLMAVAKPPSAEAGQKMKPNRHGLLVLAQGETSLHEHTVAETDAELIQMGEAMLLHVLKENATVRTTHIHTGETLRRHTPQTVGGGYYRIVRQRELDPKDIQRTRIVRD